MAAGASSYLPAGVPDSLQLAGAHDDSLYVVPESGARILTVGVGKEYTTLSAAIAASQDGDIIKVDAGTYVNDTAIINTRITIEGVGGMVNLVETQTLPNRKGILVTNNDVTIANVAFSGAAVSNDDGANGAGIRYQGGNLTLINDVFTGNQEGILGTPSVGLPTNTVTIDHCTFAGNGVSDPALSQGYGATHNVYIGTVDKLTFTNNISVAANVGHELKSRAYVNDIEDNVFADGNSDSSYSIDLPNGGADTVAGNDIEQGPNSQNGAIIHFGGEGFPYATSSLSITGNTIVNDRPQTSSVLLLNQTILPVQLTGNTIEGLTPQQIANGPVVATGNTDGSGAALPDSSATQALPSNFQVFTDDAPHTVTLTHAPSGVQGGAGLLTVDAVVGHVTVIGGSGGLDFTEEPGSGGSSITTAAGATNTVKLSGQTTVQSNGNDTITLGTGNATLQLNGTATVLGGTGNSQYAVNGTAVLTGGGGADFATISPGGNLTVRGQETYLQVGSIGGNFDISATIAGDLQQATVTGGSVAVRSYGNALHFLTSGGAQGAAIRLGAGAAAIQSQAADTIYAGSGDTTVQLSGGGGQTVYAGSGTLNIYGMGLPATNKAQVYGNGGDYFIGGDTGNIVYHGGDLDSTVEDHLGRITLIGGDGHMTLNGAFADTIYGGKGGITLNGGAGDSVTTAAGSDNTINLIGSSVVDSWGNDTIDLGHANQKMTVHGNATITGASGNNTITLLGHDSLVATGGGDTITVGAGADVQVTTAAWTVLTETAAKVHYATGDGASATISGGSASVSSSIGKPLSIQTGAGSSTAVELGGGNAVVWSHGADSIQADSGSATVHISNDGASVAGGAGALTVDEDDWTAGHNVSVQGGSGSLVCNVSGSGLTFIGGSGDTVIHGGAGTLLVTAGSGGIAVDGGAALHFVAGSGIAKIAAGSQGSTVAFGSGRTTVTEAGWGAANVYQFFAGQGGGTDIINGFRPGTDKLELHGVGVADQRVIGSMNFLMLTDGSKVLLMGVTSQVRTV